MKTICTPTNRLPAAHIVSIVLGSAVAGSAAMYYQKSQTTPTIQSGRLNSSRTRVVNRRIWQGLGASGAVMGMGAVATCLSPFAPMSLMFIPIPIPLWGLTIAYVGMDTFWLNSNSSVGHAAHLGGFAAGAIYYLAYLRNRGGLWNFVRFAMRK
jgi:membrane associated rhomboid family serine protease